MLAAMRKAEPAASKIRTVLNTHHNGDHVFGNELVADAEIIASAATAEDMEHRKAADLAQTTANWRALGPGAAFFYEMMGSRFVFAGIRHVPPTRTFSKRLDLRVGRKLVELHEVGPAHTRGDTIAWVPADRTVFAGDIVFAGGHPVLWAGPAQSWIDACDLMLSWDVETVVSGHGPVTDKAGVGELRDYLVYLRAEARKRFDAGMGPTEAAWDISLDGWRHWLDAERILVNVHTLWREFGGVAERDPLPLFALMREYRRQRCGGEGLFLELPT
jgi:glyoxylase-like metal-dependent hydrolase (beta-lactamase superfamily II)